MSIMKQRMIKYKKSEKDGNKGIFEHFSGSLPLFFWILFESSIIAPFEETQFCFVINTPFP